MFRIESNAGQVFLNLRQSMERTQLNLGENLYRAGVDTVAIIAHRVQQKGENASGQRLQTKALLRNGAYSKAHAKRRAERGRQIDQVDFTLEEDLFRSWQVLKAGPTEVTAGFLDDRQADKAEYLEEYFGETFKLSDSEQAFVAEGLADRVIDDLR